MNIKKENQVEEINYGRGCEDVIGDGFGTDYGFGNGYGSGDGAGHFNGSGYGGGSGDGGGSGFE